MCLGYRVRIFLRVLRNSKSDATLSFDWYGWSGPTFDIRSISNGKSCLDWIRTWAEIKLHCRAAANRHATPPSVAQYGRRNMCRYSSDSREMPCACLPDSGVTCFIKCNTFSSVWETIQFQRLSPPNVTIVELSFTIDWLNETQMRAQRLLFRVRNLLYVRK